MHGPAKSNHVVIKDLSERYARVSPMGDSGAYEAVRLCGTVFGAAIDTAFWTASNSGADSAAAVATAVATVTSGTANSGYGQITSVRPGRFMFAHPMLFRGGFRIPTVVVALCTRRWGAFSVSTATPQNGAYFELSASGTLSVVTVSAGTPAPVASGSFNGAVSSYTMDTNVHAYEIVYFTMGVWFYIDGVLIHKTTPTTAPLFQTLTVPITFTAVNGAAGTTSGTLECFNTSILRLGRQITSPQSRYQSGTTAGLVLKSSAGSLQGIQVSNVTVNAAITIYDNTAASGTVLWASGAMGASTTPFSIQFFDLPFFTGLTLVIATAACNVTVVYE